VTAHQRMSWPPPVSLKSAPTAALTSITESMAEKMEQQLSPARLEIINESDQHAGHAGAKGLAATRRTSS